MNKNNIWNEITSSLESVIPKSEIKTWFSGTTLIELKKDHAIIEVPNKFVSSWIKDNYLPQIKISFRKKLNLISLPEIRFIYSGSKLPKDTPNHKNKSRDRKNRLLNQNFTLNNFITAKCNRFAFSSSLEVAENPGSKYNPLYIFGKQSSGKTHLLNAIANKLALNFPSSKILITSIDMLSADFSYAAKNRKVSNFRKKYQNGDFLLIDDIHLLSGKEKLQKEFLSIFNYFHELKKQIVATGKLPPGQITGLMPELRSRLEWGLLSELQSPDSKLRMKIIKKKSKENKLNIPDDVSFFLSNSTDDLKKIETYIVNIGAYSSLNKTDINISVAKSVIKNNISNEINIEDIQKLTADYFNISLADLSSNKKTHMFSYPRHLAMYLSRELTSLSFKEIAGKFGGKDHSTVIYAVKRIKRDREKKKPVMDDINKLHNLLL